MIRLHVDPIDCNAELESSPAPYFKFEGPLVCEGPGNHLIGCFCDSGWEILGTTAACIECTERVVVRFLDWQENASSDSGPFEQLSFSADTCYAGERRVARFIDETNCWERDGDGTRWPRMLLLSEDQAESCPVPQS